jgi:hypothetical protein
MCLYCNLKRLKERQQRQKKRSYWKTKKILKEFVTPKSIIGDGTRIEEGFGSNWCQKKTRGL